jgi:hypothetical protein
MASQLVRKKQANFTLAELNAALRHVRNCCATLLIRGETSRADLAFWLLESNDSDCKRTWIAGVACK